MQRLDMDDRFYDTAMSFFVEAGHITNREPEYFNLSTDQITLDEDEYDDALLERFDNLSLLFVIHQCMFFSAELVTDRKHRSQVAHDVHGLIHSLIEMNASVCVFRLEDEMLMSFMGYGCNCVLSDWYPIKDREGLLAERLDISNVSTKGNYAYFRDLMYSLEREYYRIQEEKTIYPVFPIDCISKVGMGELSIAEVSRMVHDSLEKDFLEYGDDYVPYRASARASLPDITHEVDIMLRVPTDAGENPFGEKVETDDDDDDDFFQDDNPEENNIVSSRVSSKSSESSSSRSLKPDSEYIWVGAELVKRRTVVSERAWADEKPVNRDTKKPNTESSSYDKHKSINSLPRKGDVLTAVMPILKKTDKELGLYEIQDKTGINDLDGIASALETLCKTGNVIRSWSGVRGGRPVYRLANPDQVKWAAIRQQYMAVAQEKDKAGFRASSDFGKSWDAKRDPEDQSIENEILLVLDAMGCPIDFDDLLQRSPILSEADEDVVNSLLYGLCTIHKVYRVWVQAKRRYLYCMNTPEMRKEILRNSQREISLQDAAKAALLKAEMEEMKKGVGRPKKQNNAKKTVIKRKSSKRKSGWHNK